MSAGEAVGATVFEWARDALGVTINEMFGQTEMNYIVGNSHTLWPAKPGSMGRPYPGHRVAVIDDDGREVRARARWATSRSIASRPTARPTRCSSSSTSSNPEPRATKYIGDWCRTGDLATMDEDGYLWYQGRADDMFKVRGLPHRARRRSRTASSSTPRSRTPRWCPSPDETRGNVVKAFIVLAPGHAGTPELVEALQQHVFCQSKADCFWDLKWMLYRMPSKYS